MEYTYFTCPPIPGAIHSIDSPSDSAASATVCLEHLLPLLPHHDTFLIACYSQHPLVPLLRRECNKLIAATTGSGSRKYVTGILEASVSVCLNLIITTNRELDHVVQPQTNVLLLRHVQNPAKQGFGIVSTADIWRSALTDAVHDLFGVVTSESFVGCETTGLNGNELHDLPQAEVRQKMVDTTVRLLRRGREEGKDVMAICLGCAGMVGLDEAVREACVREMGEERGKLVHVVDGVKAGVAVLVGLAKAGC